MDETSANIGLSREEFLANLAASQVLAPAELQRLSASHPGVDALSLATVLLKSGTLTEYQFDAIVQGKGSDLRIGNYDILDRLGAGGMGTVYKARHRRMKRVVALKVLSTAIETDEEFIRRFQREVETIAKLGHPNIVMAYDADEAEAGHFLVMEYVPGCDLTAFVQKNHPLSVVVAIDCIIQAARGLAFAHAQGIIHRDIKPANLLRDTTGVVKVTDLGLARMSAANSTSSADRGLTQAGGILGTVDYMAPEQAVDSTTVDHRADIYSLGATLHFLLTGKPTFVGSSVMAVLLKHRDSPIPSLVDARPDVPRELDDVFRKMLAKTTATRYSSMTEVVSALEAIVAKPPSGGTSAPPPGSATTSELPTEKDALNTVVLGKGQTPTQTAVSVVIVELSRVQAGIIRKYLEAQDIAVLGTATTGTAAVAAVREHRPDAVVSSLHLSDTTGIDLAKKIRAEFPDHSTGFVLITSEADGTDSDALSRLDRVVLLHKPFTPDQLVQALSAATGKTLRTNANTAVSMVEMVGLKPGSGSLIAKPRSNRSAIRVLIVDDSGVARSYERTVLAGLGVTQIVEANDGAQAIAAATREAFDLIVTDYNMPLMDGYALISYLKQNPATAAIPIVMVTTETSPAVLDPVRKLGVIAVFDKTFPPNDVKQVLDKFFG